MAAEAAANVAGWSVLVSIGLLLGALAAATYAKRAWKAARDQANSASSQLRMAKVSQEEQEASKVSAWLTTSGQTVKINVLNLNDGPVYDVTYVVSARPSKSPFGEPSVEIFRDHFVALSPYTAEVTPPDRAQLGPDAYVFGYFDSRDQTRRTANGTTDVRLDHAGDWKLWNGDATAPGLAVNLSFRDSANVRWHRGWNGTLTKQK